MAGALLIVGNVWLMAALALVLGRHLERTEPMMYSFMQCGDWYSPETYNLWIGLCVAVAVAHFILSFFAWRKRA